MSIPIGQKFKTIFSLLFKPRIIRVLLSQFHSGYLQEQGWFNSFLLKTPVDKLNNPIPWLSYPSIDFLTNRLNKNISIFEYGCGNSTLFFASKVKKITSVEHDIKWYENIKRKIPVNVELLFRKFQSSDEYAKAILYSENKYDIVIIDGMDRVKAISYSTDRLNQDGIIILDDSERIEYSDGIEFILNQGFKALNFCGISAGELYKKCTTIFYKQNNCIDI